ncbi:MAG: glycosyltransferase [Chitinophagaceae bacterium]|nr:MAG: glycosyltransferase [Chitinophagaceae bacterium]
MGIRKTIIWQAHEANLSGANIAMVEYIKALRDTYDFHVVLPHTGSMCKVLFTENIAFSVIHQYNLPLSSVSAVSKLRFIIRTEIASRQLKGLVRQQNADLIFSNTLVSFLGGRVAYSLKKKHVWWIHEFGEEDFGFNIEKDPIRNVLKKTALWSRMVICNSHAVARKFGFLWPKTDVRYLYQPVSYNIASPQHVEKTSTFLMFGQISPGKGHLEVLKAVTMVNNNSSEFSLHIVGPCVNQSYLDDIQQYIIDHGLESQVTIKVGFVSKEDVLPFYDTLIVASRAEAFGRVIVEANKAGLTAIVKNAGGAPELINETNGFLYNSLTELADLLESRQLLPASEMRANYDERTELEKLKGWLAEII